MTTDIIEVKSKDYSITYQPAAAIVMCKGSLSLNGTQEYEPMLDLLLQAANQQEQKLTLNLCDLTFLNSSGINTFTKFVIQVRKRHDLELCIMGYEEIAWQVKLLRNLQRLMPTLEVQMIHQPG